MNKQVEDRRKSIEDRFAHAWNKSATRIPISVREYRALLDLWAAAYSLITNEGTALKNESISLEEEAGKLEEALEKLAELK